MNRTTTTTSDPPGGPIPSLRPFARKDRGSKSLFLRPTSGVWVVVEGAGAEVIELCDGRRDEEMIAGALAQRYGIDLRAARHDVAQYLAALRRARFFRDRPLEPRSPSAFQGLALHITARCSLSCRHCYGSPAAEHRQDPPLDLLLSAVEQARSLGAREIKLTGGDPLARLEALDALQAPTRGVDVTVLTNGIAPIDQLRDLQVERGWKLQISLDGADAPTHDWYRGPGAYERLKQNLDGLAAEALLGDVILSVCLSKVNHHHVERIVQQAVGWGVGGVHLARISRHGRAKDYWSELNLEPQAWADTYSGLAGIHQRYGDRLRLTGFLADYLLSCVAHARTRGCTPGRHVMMDLDGLIYPCIMLGKPETCLGDLHQQPLAEILASDRLTAVRAACQARLDDSGVCGDCDWRMICRGACPGWPLVQDGTLQRTDDLCAVRRELLANILFQLAEGDGGPSTATACPD